MSLFYFQFWRTYSVDTEFGAGRTFFPPALKDVMPMSFGHCFWQEVSYHFYSCFPVWNMSFIAPHEAPICFQDFLFVCFQQFNCKVLACGFLCFYFVWSLLILYLCVDIFQHTWKSFSYYLCKYFFCPFFPSSSGIPLYMCGYYTCCEYFPPHYIICLSILVMVSFSILCTAFNILYRCHCIWIL